MINGTWSLRDYYRTGKRPERMTQNYIECKLSNIGLSQYETTIDEIPNNRVEYFLWYRGRAMIWKSEILGWIVTDCYETGYDINGFPNKWRATFETVMNGEIPTPELTEEDDCVVIYDTLDPYIARNIGLVFSGDYADVYETIKQQVFNQKTPIIGIAGNPSIRNKLKNLMVKVAQNMNMIFIEQGVKDQIQTLDFNAPYNVESLHAYKKSIENEMLEYMGIDNKDAFQKKERMIVDEQEGNDELLNYILANGLESRKRGFEKLAEKGIHGRSQIRGLVRPIQEIEEVGESSNDNGIENV